MCTIKIPNQKTLFKRLLEKRPVRGNKILSWPITAQGTLGHWWFNGARSKKKKKEKQKNKIHNQRCKGQNPEWALEDEESIPRAEDGNDDRFRRRREVLK